MRAMTILDRLRRAAARRAPRGGLHAGVQRHSLAELDAVSNAAARVLRACGVVPGARVCLYAGSSLEFVLAYLGALKLGAVCVPANPAYQRTELAWILENAEPVVVVGEREALERVRALAAPSVRALLQIGAGAAPPPRPARCRGEPRTLSFLSSVRAASARRFAPRPAPDDLALIVYTSGTTGRAKGAMLRHANLEANCDALAAAFRWTADDRLVHALPLFHVHGLCVGLHGALMSGCETFLLPRFEATTVLAALARERATLFLGVPTMYSRLLECADARPFALPAMRLFVCGSAPLPPALARRFRAAFGHELLERYGMTETLITLAQPYEGPRRPGTVGLPVAGVEVRIVDAAGKDVQNGTEGELLVRGPCVGPGYWRDAAATEAAWASGWVRTGDLARRDPRDGQIAIAGRARELIISGAYKVPPREVEEVLAEHPDVAEAAVFGLPDADLGEAVAAAVVLRPGAAPDAAALTAFCRERLASYKKPRSIRFVTSLPRNAMGKVLKDRLAR